MAQDARGLDDEPERENEEDYAHDAAGDDLALRRGPVDPFGQRVEEWFDLQEEFERAESVELIRRCGVLWMEGTRDEANKASLTLMESLGVRFELLSAADLRRRYPQINSDDFEYAVLEPDAGYAFARRACRAVVEAFEREGGHYQRAAVRPTIATSKSLERVDLENGESVEADAFVFAWMSRMCLSEPSIR